MTSLLAASPRRVALLFALFGGTLLLYGPTLKHPPIWDDHTFVFGQPFLRECGNLRQVVSLESFRGVLPVRGSARPVWLASVLADTCLGGGRIAVYRATSAFWHALGAVLLAFFAWRLLKDEGTALMAGTLFAVHPLHVEPVSIITFRSDLLCLVFMLSCVLLYRESCTRAGWKAAVFLATALAAAALALLSKEMAVILPVLILLTDALFPTAAFKRRVDRRLFWAGMAACVMLLALYLVYRAPRSGYVMRQNSDVFSDLRQKMGVPVSLTLDDPPWGQVYVDPGARVRTMSRVFGSYLRRLVWPWPLQGDYAPRIISSWLHPDVLAAWAAWLALLVAAWKLRRRIPLAAYGIFWTATALLPVSGVITIFNLEADRYLYIPSAGACLAAAALLREARRRGGAWSRAAAPAFIFAVCAGVVLVERHLADFRSDEAFYRSILAIDPGVPRAHLGLAYLCVDENRPECGEQECREALRLWPGYRKAREFCPKSSRVPAEPVAR